MLIHRERRITDELTEQEIESLIGTEDLDVDQLPGWLHDSFDRNGDCDECGEHTVGIPTDGIDADFVCYSCGMGYGIHETDQDLRIGGKIKEKITERREAKHEARAEKSPAEHKKEGNASLGKMFIVLGVLFCLTLIGIPVGLILIYLGIRLQPDAEDEVEDGAD